MRYGCHDLRRGDRDQGVGGAANARIWGGVTGAVVSLCPGAQAQVAPGAANAPNLPQHVRLLQEDLRTLGFLVVGAPSGDFDMHTEWAMREFQAYAKMTHVARVRPAAPQNTHQGAHLVAALGQLAGSSPPVSVYVDSLEQVQNNGVNAGLVSGMVSAVTRQAIEQWLQEERRCTVVIEAWEVFRGNRTSLANNAAGGPGVNVWIHDEIPDTAPLSKHESNVPFFQGPLHTCRRADLQAARVVALTLSSTPISLSTSAEVKRPSGPFGITSVKGDSYSRAASMMPF